MTTLAFRSPVTRELRPYRGAKVPRPADAGDAFYVTSPFGLRDGVFHGGLDIGNGRIGYPVVAVAAGRVIAAGALGKPWSEPTTEYPSGNYGGLMVVIEHAPGVVTIYAHMRRLLVSAGQSVTPGQTIGEIGDTGSAAGQAHVHFGVQAVGMVLPAGLAYQSTPYGLGLDVDPWPLVTGAAALTLEDDVNIPNGRYLVRGTVGAGNRLRVDPATTVSSQVIGTDIGDDKAYVVQVYQRGVKGQPYTLGGKPGDTYSWVGVFGRTWFVADPLVTDLAVIAEELPPADCSAQEQQIAQLNAKLGGIRTAAAGAQQAIEAVLGLAG